MRGKSYRKTYRARKKRPILKSRLFWFLVLAFTLTNAGSYFALFYPKFQLNEIKISGNQKVNNQEVEQFIKAEVQKKLAFIQSQSIFLTDSGKIAKSLLQKYPLIEAAEAKRILPGSLVIEIRERSAAGVWCKLGKCFSIDRNGVIFEETAVTSGLVIEDEASGASLAVGAVAVSPDTMKSLIDAYQTIANDMKVGIKKCVILDNQRVNIITVGGWEIYFTTKKDISWQLTKLKAVWDKEIPVSRRSDLEYIELRFGNLAVYRYKQ